MMQASTSVNRGENSGSMYNLDSHSCKFGFAKSKGYKMRLYSTRVFSWLIETRTLHGVGIHAIGMFVLFSIGEIFSLILREHF